MENIKAIFFDVDGVLTPGDITFDNKGNEIKSFNSKDGLVVKILQNKDFILAAITGRTSKAVENRMESLNIEEVFMGIKDKIKVYEDLKIKYNLKDENIAYIGDDINDLPILKKCGFSSTPNDTMEYMKQNVDYITSNDGGKGCFREFCDKILFEKYSKEEIINIYIRENDGNQ